MRKLELEQGNGGHVAWLGVQELGSHELEKMGSNGTEFAMVQGQFRADKQGRDWPAEVEKTVNFWVCKEFGVTRRRSSTNRGTRSLTK